MRFTDPSRAQPMQQDPKLPWQSRTFWVGVLTILVSVLTLLKGDEFISSYPHVVALIGAILGVAIIALRFATDTAIKWIVLLALALLPTARPAMGYG